MLAVYGALRERRSRRWREAFLRGRLPYSDERLVQDLGVIGERERRVCCAIRRAVARQLGLLPEMLRPTDDMYTLSFKLHYWVKIPEQAAREAITQELGQPVDWWYETIESSEGRGTLAARTFGQFLQFYVERLDRLTDSSQKH